ncbi:basic leucine zipper transcriptional factor ATF-like 3 [Trichomycterus rosablanca]|uniref:basic leucine zipper transcriptional factor ATF-like 3 n=1 Tax=Trichomycterus rosablanca TaxID=2290929 RepID=UPI002F35D45C
MPVAVMEGLDEETNSCYGSESQSPQDWGNQTGKGVYQQRQRNRDAARKSRKKQTERADILHEELQTLECSNAAFVKEIAELKKELQHYTTALNEHETHCTLLHWPTPSVPVTASGPSKSTSNLIQNPNPSEELFLLSTQDTATEDFSLAEILDEWLP